ncbi:ankyrin repeat domain-containing protein [Parashewanella tropica]|uniref:ankyrin repeat domain-containing protein n=1 Tax=Parashewanella tropica TaxID=2547970 RepID=UPI00105A8C72|nr:ankyrin repeat domain-containing protein [Parashewanella tropica]
MLAVDVSLRFQVRGTYRATDRVVFKSSPQKLYQVTETGKAVTFSTVLCFHQNDTYSSFKSRHTFVAFSDSYKADIKKLKKLVEKFFIQKEQKSKLQKIETFEYHLFEKSDSCKVIDQSVPDYRCCLYGEARLEFHRVVHFVEGSPLPFAMQIDLIDDMIDGLDTCTGGVQSRISEAYRKLHFSYLGANGVLKNLCSEMVKVEAQRYFTEQNRGSSYRSLGREYESHIVHHLIRSVDPMFAIEAAADDSGIGYRRKYPEHYYSHFARQVGALLTASHIMSTICERYFENLTGHLQRHRMISATNSVVDFTQIKGELLQDINLLVLEPFNSFLLDKIKLSDLLNYDGSSSGVDVRSLNLHWLGILQRQYRAHFAPMATSVCTLTASPHNRKQQQTVKPTFNVKQAWGNFFWVQHKGTQTGLNVYQILHLARRETNRNILTGYLNALEVNSLEEAKQCLSIVIFPESRTIHQLLHNHPLVQFRVFNFFNTVLEDEFIELQQQLAKNRSSKKASVDYDKLTPLRYLSKVEFQTLKSMSNNRLQLCIVVEQARRGILITSEQAMHICRLGKLELILRDNSRLAADGVNQVFSFLLKESDTFAIQILLSFIHSQNPSLDAKAETNCCPERLLLRVVTLNSFKLTAHVLKLLPPEALERELQIAPENGSILHQCIHSNHLNAFKALIACESINLNQMTAKGTALQMALSHTQYQPFLLQLLQQGRLRLFLPLQVEQKCNFELAQNEQLKILTTELTQRLKRAREALRFLPERPKTTIYQQEQQAENDWEQSWEKVESCGEINVMYELIHLSFNCHSIADVVNKIKEHPALNWQSAHVYFKNLAWCIKCSGWIANPKGNDEQTRSYIRLLPNIPKPLLACWLEFAKQLNVDSLTAAIIIHSFNENLTEHVTHQELNWLCQHPELIPLECFDRDYPQKQQHQLLLTAIKTGNVQLVEQRLVHLNENLPLAQSLPFIPLIEAVKAKQPQVAIKIIEHAPEQVSLFCSLIGGNAFQLAAYMSDSPEVIKAMLPYCKINELAPCAYSALDFALERGHINNVQQLLTHQHIDLFRQADNHLFIYKQLQGKVSDERLNHAIVHTSGHDPSREAPMDVKSELAPYRFKWLALTPDVSHTLHQFNQLLSKCDADALVDVENTFTTGFNFKNKELKRGMIRILQAHLAVRLNRKPTHRQSHERSTTRGRSQL